MAWDSAFRVAVCMGAFASWALSFLLGFLFVTHDGWLGRTVLIFLFTSYTFKQITLVHHYNSDCKSEMEHRGPPHDLILWA